jgi:hypothetical protein
MTAWLEVSRVQFGMKGGFSPVLVEQSLLNCRYLSVHRKKTGVKGLCFRTFPIVFREGFRIYPSKQHLFIKFLSSY